MFAYFSQHSNSAHIAYGLKSVIYMYAIICTGVGLIILCFSNTSENQTANEHKSEASLLHNLKEIVSIKELWLMTLIIFCGYQQFWATYLFSGYMQEGGFGLSAVAAEFIVAVKLWMRPIGGIGGGILGDKFSNISVLIIVLLLSATEGKNLRLDI